MNDQLNSQLIEILESERHKLLFRLSLIEQTLITYRHSTGESFPLPEELTHNFIQLDEQVHVDAEQQLLQKYKHFNAGMSIKRKVICIIYTEGRFLHVREIARILQQLEDAAALDPLIKKVSPALSILKRIPASPIVSVAVANSHFNTFYGCRDWLTENGEIKQPFMYNPDELKKGPETVFI
jgi:hypothetical protein